MPEQKQKPVHLPDLVIKEFRGIKDLSLPRLGRVTLFGGRNSVGKTTVLEAVQVFAARGRFSVLRELLEGRDEFEANPNDEDRDVVPDFLALFHGWDISKRSAISIGRCKGANRLTIKVAAPSDEEAEELARIRPELSEEEVWRPKITFGKRQQTFPWLFSASGQRFNLPMRRRPEPVEMPAAIKCESLGPGLLGNDDMARLWDNIAATDDEARAAKALSLIFGSRVNRIRVIGDRRSKFRGRRLSFGGGSRRVVIRLDGYEHRVPLKSLGDGASRLFGTALALAQCRDGILVIDEAENGIHHSVQVDFWRMVLQTARECNVQVFATTHSKDCINGFARATSEIEGSEGMYVRLEQNEGQVRAITYSESELLTVAEQNIEAR